MTVHDLTLHMPLMVVNMGQQPLTSLINSKERSLCAMRTEATFRWMEGVTSIFCKIYGIDGWQWTIINIVIRSSADRLGSPPYAWRHCHQACSVYERTLSIALNVVPEALYYANGVLDVASCSKNGAENLDHAINVVGWVRSFLKLLHAIACVCGTALLSLTCLNLPF